MIKLFTTFLLNRFIKDHKNINDPAIRAKYGILEGWISVIVNLLLGLIKISIAIIYSSISLLADAIHSLSDLATSLIIIIAFKIGQKPGDKKHPFGHGRMEQIASLIIAVLLGVGGIELIQYSFKRISTPQIVSMDWIPIIIIILTVFLKEGLGRISKYLGEKINSLALEADAWHHRTDAISSSFVIIALIATKYGFYYLDGIAGLIIGLYIIYLGWEIARKSVDHLLGEAPNEKVLQEVDSIARKNPIVKDIHDVIIHEYGIHKIISLHIEIPDNLALSEAHTIAEQIETDLKEQLNIYATIHLDPILPPSEKSKKIENVINEYITNSNNLVSSHDLRLIGEDQYSNLLFSVTSNLNLSIDEKENIKEEILSKINAVIPEVKNIHIKFVSPYKFGNEL